MRWLGPLSGFAVTLRQIFRPKVTTQYPEVKRVKPARFHGRHVLNRYPDGMEKCIGCELCAGVCPARCIYVRGEDNPPDAPVSPGERYGFVYEINMLRCIFCALCVEACPTEAITMTHLFEMSVTNRDDAIYTRAELLMDEEGNVPHPEPESILIDKGELRLGDGWLRATSPSGRVEYEGVVAWTPTAGVGLRPPERGQSLGVRGLRPEGEHQDAPSAPRPPTSVPPPREAGRGQGGGPRSSQRERLPTEPGDQSAPQAPRQRSADEPGDGEPA